MLKWPDRTQALALAESSVNLAVLLLDTIALPAAEFATDILADAPDPAPPFGLADMGNLVVSGAILTASLIRNPLLGYVRGDGEDPGEDR